MDYKQARKSTKRNNKMANHGEGDSYSRFLICDLEMNEEERQHLSVRWPGTRILFLPARSLNQPFNVNCLVGRGEED